MKKKVKKSQKKKQHSSKEDSEDSENTEDVDVEISKGKKKKSGLRRHRRNRGREDSSCESDSDARSQKEGKCSKGKKKKKGKGSRTLQQTTSTSTSGESSKTTGETSESESGESQSSEVKVKEVTEKDLVERLQKMVVASTTSTDDFLLFWNRWTLAPLYHFVRKPNVMLTIAFFSDPDKEKSDTVKRLLAKIYSERTQNSTGNYLLVTFNDIIPDFTGSFTYFMKKVKGQVTPDNFEDILVLGNVPPRSTCKGEALVPILGSLVGNVWEPLFLDDTDREACLIGIRNELTTDLSSLSSAAQTGTHLLETGNLLLWVPSELGKSESLTISELSKDNNFCTRLEETVIKWISRLKEIIHLEEIDHQDDSIILEPQDEIRFWKERSSNLTQVLSQLLDQSSKTSKMRRLLEILRIIKSPYLQELSVIFREISVAQREASSNFHYLQRLTPVCSRLAGRSKTKLRDIPDILKKFIWTVLVIWKHAPFYNTEKRLTGLLGKFSNALISHLRGKLRIPEILHGRWLQSGEKNLRNCLKCLRWWRRIYAEAEEMAMREETVRKWPFSKELVFSNTDAFKGRLEDLLEICVVQKVFGRRFGDSGKIKTMPEYFGVRGPLIKAVMKKIVREVNNDIVRKLSSSSDCDLLLDLSSSSNDGKCEWFGKMHEFRVAVINIEMRIQNFLEENFDQMANLEGRLRLLEQFYIFASRTVVIRQLEKLTIRLWEYFEEEILRVKRLFQDPPRLSATFPTMAGSCQWAAFLKKRIDGQLELLKKAEPRGLPKSVFSESVKSLGKSVVETLSQHSLQMFQEWSSSCENLGGAEDLNQKCLQTPLLLRTASSTILEVNFDRSLYAHLMEAELFQKIGFQVPANLSAIFVTRENFHLLRESAARIAKFYMDATSGLSRDEKLLFKGQMIPIEKQIYPLMSTLTWTCLELDPPPPQIPNVPQFRKLRDEILSKVGMYRFCNFRVVRICSKMSTWKTVKVDRKKIYTLEEFHESQSGAIEYTMGRALKKYRKIVDILHELHRIFQNDSPEVLVQWEKYTKLMDSCVQESLCICLRNSLGILEQAVCPGTGESQKPFLKIEVKLGDRGIVFEPELEQLRDLILGIHGKVANALRPLSRVSDFLEESDAVGCWKSGPFTRALMEDELSNLIQARLKFALEKTLSELSLYSERWTPYQDIWTVDMETFLSYYETSGVDNLNAVQRDLAKYREIADVIQGSESEMDLRFLRVDWSQLKTGIETKCLVWYRTLGESLYRRGRLSVENIFQYVETNRRKFLGQGVFKGDLNEQRKLWGILQGLRAEVPRKAAEFPLMRRQFQVLKKFEFPLEKEIEEKVATFENSWTSYGRFLKDIENDLEKSWKNLRVAFLERAERFRESVKDLWRNFEVTGPFSLLVGNEASERALGSLGNFMEQIGTLEKEETELIDSLRVFHVERKSSESLAELKVEVQDLSGVWEHVREWTFSHYGKWNLVRIQEIPLDTFLEKVGIFREIFSRLNKEFERKAWPLIGEMIEFLDKVRKTLEIIPCLTSGNLKDRHWSDVVGSLGVGTGTGFQVELTLESLMSRQFHMHGETIAEMESSSGKEAVIEETLGQIWEFWKNENFLFERKMCESSVIPFEIAVGESFGDTLMDHLVTLEAMKGSRFLEPFKIKLNEIETSLNRVKEVQVLLETQKQWKFMEKVFSLEEIGKMMPREGKSFRACSALWASIVSVIASRHHGNILCALEDLEELETMLWNLQEKMQKLRASLKISLLQEKRQGFPRLYFLCDDDLLELIGNSGNPWNVPEILRKMFGGLSATGVTWSSEESDGKIDGVLVTSGELLKFHFPTQLNESMELEAWLQTFEKSINSAIKIQMEECLKSLMESKNLQQFLQLSPPGSDLELFPFLLQCCLTCLRIQWTHDVTRTIQQNKVSLKRLSKKLNRDLTKLVELSRENLENLEKLKTSLIITSLIYLRDVTENLYKRSLHDLQSFEWLQLLRFYWDPKLNLVLIRQGFAEFQYGYELMGHFGTGGPTVISSEMMERSFLAITTALNFHSAGFLLQGPGNSGKVETIKELARQLGRPHVLSPLSLSEQTDFQSVARVITGLVATGAWTVLNFNSSRNYYNGLVPMVTSKLQLISRAKCENVPKIMLEGVEVPMNRDCALFAVIADYHPGESFQLTDRQWNQLMDATRPVSILPPDHANIAQVRLFIGGFEDSFELASKLDDIFKNARIQLITTGESRCQFSLCGILAVVDEAIASRKSQKFPGKAKEKVKQLSESEVICRSLEKIVLPALESGDEKGKFMNLMKKHFPQMDAGNVTGESGCRISSELTMDRAIRDVCVITNNKFDAAVIRKCLELHELMQVYTGIILVGKTGTGKSTTRKILGHSLELTSNEMVVKEYGIAPATLDQSELYGFYDDDKEWNDGILPKIYRGEGHGVNSAGKGESQLWIVFDGPISGNFKQLFEKCHGDQIALPNCDLIPLPPMTFHFLEVENLQFASPGLVARAGVIYFNGENETWKLSLEAWVSGGHRIGEIFVRIGGESLVEKCLHFRKTQCSTHIPCLGRHTMAQMLMTLMTSFFDYFAKVEKEESGERLNWVVKNIFLFCLTWSIFGDLNEESELKANTFVKDLDSTVFPIKGMIFDYVWNPEIGKWSTWETMGMGYSMETSCSNANSMISTVDTMRSEYLVNLCRHATTRPILLAGYTDSGKTELMTSMILKSRRENFFSSILINMTPSMEAKCLQSLIASRLEQVSMITMAPSRGKQMTVFIDDLNASRNEANSYAEFLRHFIEQKMWYDRKSRSPVGISNVSIIASTTLGESGSNSNKVGDRLQSKFSVIYISNPDEFQLRRIFTARAKQKFENFPPPVKLLSDGITVATLEIFKAVQAQIPASGSRPWQIFSLKDISRIYQGLHRATRDTQNTKLCFLRLWFHECTRVFEDRLVETLDREKCREILAKQLLKHFELSVQTLHPSGRFPPVFANFMSSSRNYEEVREADIEMRKFLEKAGESLSAKGKVAFSPFRKIILFQDAIRQICRLARVLSEPKGHLMILGVDGQGRETLTRLVCSVYNYKIIQFRSMDHQQKIENVLRDAYKLCASEDVAACLILKDDQICEQTLEHIGLLTSSVELPDVFTAKELQQVKLKKAGKSGVGATVNSANGKAGILDYFRERVEKNLHVVLCANPSSECFRKLMLNYPNLLKHFAVNHFDIWSKESYTEVARILLLKDEIERKQAEVQAPNPETFYRVHEISQSTGQNFIELESGKFSWITPMHFLDFLEHYHNLSKETFRETRENLKLLNGALQEVSKVRDQIDFLQENFERAQEKVEESELECAELENFLRQQEAEWNSEEIFVDEKRRQLESEIKDYDDLAQVIKNEWTEALDEFEETAGVLQDLNEEDLAHIIHSFYNPPPEPIPLVLNAVMVMLDAEQSWEEVKSQIGNPNFVPMIIQYDKGKITMEKIDELRVKIVEMENGNTPEDISKYSKAARILWEWVVAIEKYGRIYLTRIVPKREKLESCESSILGRRRSVDGKREKLKFLQDSVQHTRDTFQERSKVKMEVTCELEKSREILERARKILELLENNVAEWQKKIGKLGDSLEYVPGNSFLSAACLSYFGPFPENLRVALRNRWMSILRNSGAFSLKISADWNLCANLLRKESFLPFQLRCCFSESSESFLRENLLMLGKSLRPVLLVDPQNVAPLILMANSGRTDKCSKVVYLESSDSGHGQILESYEQLGVKEKENGNGPLGIVVTTRTNPEIPRTIAARFSVVNVTLSGEDLEVYFQSEFFRLERSQDSLRLRTLCQTCVAEEHSISQVKISIPRTILNCANSSILENPSFVETIKKWQSDLGESEIKLEESLKEIGNLERSKKDFVWMASMLCKMFHSICDVSGSSNSSENSPAPQCLYETSLSYFSGMLEKVLQKKFELFNSQEGREDESPRMTETSQIESFMREKGFPLMFAKICRSMFSTHRYQFALHLSLKVIGPDDRSPFDLNLRSQEGEETVSLSQIEDFAGSVLGNRFKEEISSPPLLDLKEVFDASSKIFPVIVFLHSGSCSRNRQTMMNPYKSVLALAKELTPPRKLYSLTIWNSKKNLELGGKLLEVNVQKGHWVFVSMIDNDNDLNNVNVQTEFLQKVDKIVEKFQNQNNPNHGSSSLSPDFRLWLWISSDVQILQNSPAFMKNATKVALEPPRTLQASIKRLKQKMWPQFQQGTKSDHYLELLEKLVNLHCRLSGRTDADFEISAAIAKLFCLKYPSETVPFPWWALKHMLELQYGASEHAKKARALIHQLFQTGKTDGNEPGNLAELTVDSEFENDANFLDPSQVSKIFLNVKQSLLKEFQLENMGKLRISDTYVILEKQ